jgi:hypothetical protein
MNARVGQDTRACCPTVSRRADGNNTLMKTQIQATEVRDFIRSLHLCTLLFETSNFCILFKNMLIFHQTIHRTSIVRRTTSVTRTARVCTTKRLATTNACVSRRFRATDDGVSASRSVRVFSIHVS